MRCSKTMGLYGGLKVSDIHRRKGLAPEQSSTIQYAVGKEVRDTIEKLGGTMPEELPTPQKSISQVEREQLKKLKEERKKLMLDE